MDSGSVVNKKKKKKKAVTTKAPERKRGQMLLYRQHKDKGRAARSSSPPCTLFKGTNNEATRITLKAAHSQSACEGVQARQGEWKVVLFGVCVCVCVCARWKERFVLAIDCGPVRSNVSRLTQTNTDVEAVKKKKKRKKKGWLGVFWCFPEVDREMPVQRIVGFAIVSDGNNDETDACDTNI